MINRTTGQAAVEHVLMGVLLVTVIGSSSHLLASATSKLYNNVQTALSKNNDAGGSVSGGPGTGATDANADSTTGGNGRPTLLASNTESPFITIGGAMHEEDGMLHDDSSSETTSDTIIGGSDSGVNTDTTNTDTTAKPDKSDPSSKDSTPPVDNTVGGNSGGFFPH